ncbi:type II secretion system protein [Phragmitibacter flavus]|uniref:Type II secretion system protein n=1 Tax=Phragmitibacter flavus TaxID=2576071 RepID=A0A5R8KIP7_9BACT|nr:type II secretion system protein [Phragmitibacter flavus]TLD72130.1 type II secretion system protein [Phragmitibacter flavus]
MNTNKFHGQRAARARAFTLIELLVVMAIIAILATLTLGAFTYAQQAAARNRTTGAMAAIRAALEQYKEKFGEYPEPMNEGTAVSGAKTGGAKMLYQAITGDGTDAIKLTSGGTPSDGEVDEEEIRNAINASLPPAMIFPPRSAMSGAVEIYLVDGFGRPFQYEKAATTGTATTINPTYDLWSFGNLEGDAPGTVSLEQKSDVAVTGPWIKNW